MASATSRTIGPHDDPNIGCLLIQQAVFFGPSEWHGITALRRAGGDPPPPLLAYAMAAAAHCVVSGDTALLHCSGLHGVEVVTPRMFVDRHLN